IEVHVLAEFNIFIISSGAQAHMGFEPLILKGLQADTRQGIEELKISSSNARDFFDSSPAVGSSAYQEIRRQFQPREHGERRRHSTFHPRREKYTDEACFNRIRSSGI
ncbi:hypothetical protein Dimus_003646, partial [Dionaea muscipula]